MDNSDLTIDRIAETSFCFISKRIHSIFSLCGVEFIEKFSKHCKLTESWMDKLMERTVFKGQTVDDLLRRSAGIPAAFTALFLSEPEGAPKKLLPRALQWLIDLANSSLLGPLDANDMNADSCNFSLSKSDQNLDSAQVM